MAYNAYPIPYPLSAAFINSTVFSFPTISTEEQVPKMKKIPYIIILLFVIWLVNHPNTKALIKGISSVAVDAPIAKAKSDFREAAEKRAQQEAEARMKQIDAAINAADQRTVE
jgi:hypothetical protein